MIGFRHVIQQTVDAEVNVNVNSVNEGTFSALSDINVNVTDGVDPVTPDAVIVSGQNIEIQVPAASAPVGATLMKTGQTISYASTDDGDIEAGRASSFTVLANANPFGNTNRFTDVAGGQTYTLAIVIDWSTYDGSTVTGYRKTKSSGYTTWSTALTNAAGTSIGTYTTGWRLPNRAELYNIMNHGVATSVLNYSPFSITADTNLWTGTTNNLNTSAAFTLNSTGNGSFGSFTKASAAAEYIPCRTFTVTGTTLS